jgi:uncharacterized protein (DUF2147 family)
MRQLATIAAAIVIFTGGAASAVADPIEGTWKRGNGTLIEYASSGGNEYCGTVTNGEYQGQSIGCMSGADGSYKGSVIKLDEGKTYNGTAKVSGNDMVLQGCVALILCKSEKLVRQ